MNAPASFAFQKNVNIGPHELWLADAYVLRPLLGWMDADILDPQYKFRVSGGGRYRKRRPNMDLLAQEGLHKGFRLEIVNPLLCGSTIVFAHNDQLAGLLSHLHGSFHRHALCVWQKTNPQPVANKHYRPDLEFYAHAWQPGYHPQGDIADLLRVSRMSSPRMGNRHGHPTCKPLELMEKIVRNVAGETICDPFMGSGTTGVAAVKAGRRFVGIERNPVHFETACKRIAEAHSEAIA